MLIKSVAEMKKIAYYLKTHGEKISFIPTMGNIHDGHLALLKKASEFSKKKIVSIFINPMQFNNQEDYARYPSTLERDLDLLLSCDKETIVFAPKINEIYPQGFHNHTTVSVPVVSTILEGESRSGHFDGVSTIVTKLFSIISPDYSFFGEKDYQQLIIVKKINNDLGLGGEIVSIPIVRDTNGLAFSSRNSLLSQEAIKIAPKIYETLQEIASVIKYDDSQYEKEIAEATRKLNRFGFTVDKVFYKDAETLHDVSDHSKSKIILLAAWLDNIRLIDNIFII